MPQSELNKQLLEAISDKGSYMENDFKGNNTFEDSKQSFREVNTRIAANECEKLCLKYSLQSQIDLLKEIHDDRTLIGRSILIEYSKKLQQQLNNLK